MLEHIVNFNNFCSQRICSPVTWIIVITMFAVTLYSKVIYNDCSYIVITIFAVMVNYNAVYCIVTTISAITSLAVSL